MMLPSAASQALILLAEDHPDDLLIIRLAFRRASIPNPLFVARDGQEVVEYLGGEGQYANRNTHPLPRLMILDIKMPRMDGFDVLKWLQGHPELKQLPVVVLSGSEFNEDILRAKDLGACDYRVKPTGVENYMTLVHELHTTYLDSASPLQSPSHI